MKRFLLLLMVIVLFPVDCSASSIKPTEKRGAIEFTELFAKRLIQYTGEKNSLTEYEFGRKNTMSSIQIGDEMTITSSAGMLVINKSTFEITELITTFYNYGDADEENEKSINTCIVAISALEFDRLSETTLPLETLFSKEKKNPVSEANRILSDFFHNVFDNAELYSRLIDDKEVLLVYSGNYDYYFSYSDDILPSGEKNEIIYLFAEAR